MKTKIFVVGLFSVLLVCGTIVSLHSNTEHYPVLTTDLIAGQQYDVGDVIVWYTDGFLNVQYVVTAEDLCLTKTHLHVATTPDEIPQTKKGNPIPGHFEFSIEHDCVTEYTYPPIELEQNLDNGLYIAAHAVVKKTSGTGMVCASQVVSSWQGPMKNGNPVSDRGYANCDPSSALGMADSTAGHHETFFSLGYGGNIVLGFENPVGGSLTVYEVTWGTFPEEKADVYVSQDGTTWTLLGTADNRPGTGGDDPYPTTFGLDTCIKYVKIVDTTNPALHGLVSDAFDVDAVCAEYVCKEETAWGAGDGFPGNNWAMYLNYPGPKILVITQNTQTQSANDRDLVLGYLDNLGYYYVSIDEPGTGLTATGMFQDYDAVIYLTWSYPIGYINPITAQTLVDYFTGGGALVVSGDDATWVSGAGGSHPYQNTNPSYENAWESMTHLDYVNNGATYVRGINGYSVTIGNQHPVVENIEGATFTYPIDIDTTDFLPDTVLTGTATPLATATPVTTSPQYPDITGGYPLVAFESSECPGKVVIINMAFYNGYTPSFGDYAIPEEIAKKLLDNSIKWVAK